MGRASKDKRDIYYRKAKEDGYRARSAYKLLQISEEFHIFDNVTRCVDLCAAPGSWSQVLASTMVASPQRRIVAVDLQEMAPIQGVILLQGDITTTQTAEEIIRCLGDEKAELVVCDGAPDVTGLHELDEYMQHQLLLAALCITTFVLRSGGTFVAKVFRGPNTNFLCAKFQIFFQHVVIAKPKSSRNASMEAFIVCQNYSPPPNYVPSMTNPVTLESFFPDDMRIDDLDRATTRTLAPFLACGDLSAYDADMCYPVEEGSSSLPPVQPPTTVPYREALARKRQR